MVKTVLSRFSKRGVCAYGKTQHLNAQFSTEHIRVHDTLVYLPIKRYVMLLVWLFFFVLSLTCDILPFLKCVSNK